MKRFLLAAAIVLVASVGAQAQTEKGTWLLGGNTTFQATDGATIFNASPNIGYFFSNNLAAGLEASFLSADGASIYAFGPFIKPYFGKSEKGKFFGKGSFLLVGGEGDSQAGFGLGAGYALFLNRSVALEFGANYNKLGEGSGTFGLGVGFQIHFKK
jgi:hypothetical protein